VQIRAVVPGPLTGGVAKTMRTMQKSPVALAAAFFFAATLAFVFLDDLLGWLLFLAFPIPYVLQFTCVAISFYAAYRLFIRNKKSSAIAIVITALLANTLLLLFGIGWGVRARLILFLPHYSSIVSRVLNNPPALYAENIDEGYRVEPGPPVRVAFPRPFGLLNRWSAIVYDPSGQVMVVNDVEYLHPRDPNLAQIQDLFGGKLGHSEHLVGPWYLCGFH
jgi:hypothetical protein